MTIYLQLLETEKGMSIFRVQAFMGNTPINLGEAQKGFLVEELKF